MAVPGVLFDTPILMDLLERRPRTIARLRALSEQGARMAISILTMAEIHASVAQGEEEATGRLLELFDVLPLTEDLVKSSGALVAHRRRLGRAYALDDMLIAATAIEHGYQLYTTNKKDFEVPKLVFYAPEK